MRIFKFIKAFYLYIIIVCFAVKQDANGQSRPDFTKLSSNTTTGSSEQADVPLEDAYVKFFELNDIENIKEFSDTTLLGFEIFGKHRLFDSAAFNLGNYGSASKPIIYKNQRDIYTDIGYHQYDLYKLKLQNFKYYKINRPYNDLYFSPLSGQQNFEVKANFSKNFANDVNLSIDYERIKQEGFYPDQDNKMTKFGLGIWKHNEEKNHDIFFSFLANNFNESHNGGIDTSRFDVNALLSGTTIRNPRGTASTNLSGSSKTRHQQFTYALDNFWSAKSDKFKMHHQISVEHGYYKMSDENVNTALDSVVYKEFIKDSRGIRSFNSFVRMSNQIDIGLDIKNFDLTLGFKYKLLKYNNTIESELRNDLGVFADLHFEIGDISQLNAFAELGVGENAGNFQLKGNLSVKPIKSIELNAFANIIRYDPTLIQNEFVSTEQYVFQNEFSKVNNINLGGSIDFQKFGIQLEANSGLIDQAIYNNIESLPAQLNGSTEYLQAKVKQRLFWKFIGLENSAIYQTFTDNIYQLPKVYSQHNLYLQSRMFKKRLLAKVGVLFYNTQFDGNSKFQPANGGFYPTEDVIEDFPYAELYGVFQVDMFRIFFRYNNFVDAFQPEVHYHIFGHPQYDARFRMGVRWVISD